MCVVKSDKNGPENSPTKPPARAPREPEAAGAAGAPRRPPRDPETARAAGAAAAGTTIPGPETRVGAIRRRGRPAGEGDGAAAGAEAASRAGEKGSAAAAAAIAAATETALARGPVNSHYIRKQSKNDPERLLTKRTTNAFVIVVAVSAAPTKLANC